MKLNSITRTSGALAGALALSVSLAACGGSSTEDAGSAASDTASSAAPSEEPSEAPSESDTAAAAGAGADTFGDACSAVPTSGKGSFDGMVQDPVATAASNNPLLGTLVSAVGAADLVDTLNSAPALTVFAPTDDAFKKIPAKTLNAVLKDKKTLTAILTHHVIGKQLGPDEIAGTQDTLNGDTLKIMGDATDGVTVKNPGGNATVLCGNIPTANATVYVLDTVLMPS